MNKRIIFCVETTKQSNTDYPYIRETIRHFYIENMQITIRPVFMESKTRYNSRTVQEKINKECAFSKQNHIIYCVDTDNWNTSAEEDKLLGKIKAYCQSKHYDFIFFCRDIEEVYCGERIPDTKKASAVAQFRRSQSITKINSEMLEKQEPQIRCSNILAILDQYLERKKV